MPEAASYIIPYPSFSKDHTTQNASGGIPTWTESTISIFSNVISLTFYHQALEQGLLNSNINLC